MNNIEKIASAIEKTSGIIGDAFSMGGKASNIREVGALGALAAPSAYNLAAGKDKTTGDKVKDGAEVAGLGALAVPYMRKGFMGAAGAAKALH